MCNIDNLITNNQTNVPLEVLKALLSGGTKNESTKQETRVSEQLGCLRARARSPTQEGLSLCESNWKGGTTLFSREQGNYTVLSLSLRVGVSHEVESSHYASA